MQMELSDCSAQILANTLQHLLSHLPKSSYTQASSSLLLSFPFFLRSMSYFIIAYATSIKDLDL